MNWVVGSSKVFNKALAVTWFMRSAGNTKTALPLPRALVSCENSMASDDRQQRRQRGWCHRFQVEVHVPPVDRVSACAGVEDIYVGGGREEGCIIWR